VKFDSPLHNVIILAGNRAGDLYVGAVFGPPVMHDLLISGKTRDFALAYSRSKKRASNGVPVGFVTDVTGYSLPTRDIVALDSGCVVLRNREDVLNARTSELWLGRHADRYDASGRQLATAVFPSSVHWITAVTQTEVRGINRDGTVQKASWGRPLPAEITP
jgi:hypothetical protein